MCVQRLWAIQQYDDHYGDVIMGAIASLITSLTIVYSTVYSDADQRKHQSSASLAFVWGIHRGPVNSPHKWPVTRKMFPYDDVIMQWEGVACLKQNTTLLGPSCDLPMAHMRDCAVSVESWLIFDAGIDGRKLGYSWIKLYDLSEITQ